MNMVKSAVSSFKTLQEWLFSKGKDSAGRSLKPNGKQECARRLVQISRGQLQLS